MPFSLLLPESKLTPAVLAFTRILIGSFMLYHGVEVFDYAKMQDYIKWFTDEKMFAPAATAYTGKIAECVAGVLLITGFLTRIGAFIMLVTMLIISFGIGEGRVFMQEQHPFLFCVFGILFLIAGGGPWSVDKWISGRTP